MSRTLLLKGATSFTLPAGFGAWLTTAIAWRTENLPEV